MGGESGFACNLRAMNGEERSRYALLRAKLQAAVDEITEVENGFEFRLTPGAVSTAEIAEWVEYEEKCCPFLGLGIATGLEQGPIGVRITGETGVKEFIWAEFGAK